MSEPKYYVVQVLEDPLKDISEYWCVLRDWVQIRGPGDPKVLVTFPYRHLSHEYPLLELSPSPTERQLKETSKKWITLAKITLLSVVKYKSDSYGDLKRYFRKLQIDKYEEEKSSTSPRIATLSAKDDFMTNVLGLLPFPKLRQPANTKAQKRKAADGGRKPYNKISKVTEPNEIGEQVAGLSKQPFELLDDYQPLDHAMPVEETQEASVGKSNETKIQHTSTEDQPTVNASEANHSLEDTSRKSLSESNIAGQTEQSKTLISLMTTLEEQLKKIYPTLEEIKSTNNNLETTMASLSAQNEELKKNIEQLEVKKEKDRNYIAFLERTIKAFLYKTL